MKVVISLTNVPTKRYRTIYDNPLATVVAATAAAPAPATTTAEAISVSNVTLVSLFPLSSPCSSSSTCESSPAEGTLAVASAAATVVVSLGERRAYKQRGEDSAVQNIFACAIVKDEVLLSVGTPAPRQGVPRWSFWL